jgi:hypothetical protein
MEFHQVFVKLHPSVSSTAIGHAEMGEGRVLNLWGAPGVPGEISH